MELSVLIWMERTFFQPPGYLEATTAEAAATFSARKSRSIPVCPTTTAEQVPRWPRGKWLVRRALWISDLTSLAPRLT